MPTLFALDDAAVPSGDTATASTSQIARSLTVGGTVVCNSCDLTFSTVIGIGVGGVVTITGPSGLIFGDTGISNGGSVTVNNGGSFTSGTGDITNSGSITVKSGGTLAPGTGNLINSGTIVNFGTISVVAGKSIQNSGTITNCGGTIIGTVTGNPVMNGGAACGAVIPEYPYGLPLLAILTVLAYGVIRHKTRD